MNVNFRLFRRNAIWRMTLTLFFLVITTVPMSSSIFAADQTLPVDVTGLEFGPIGTGDRSSMRTYVRWVFPGDDHATCAYISDILYRGMWNREEARFQPAIAFFAKYYFIPQCDSIQNQTVFQPGLTRADQETRSLDARCRLGLTPDEQKMCDSGMTVWQWFVADNGTVVDRPGYNLAIWQASQTWTADGRVKIRLPDGSQRRCGRESLRITPAPPSKPLHFYNVAVDDAGKSKLVECHKAQVILP
jgi:hypothetical protein